jgi:metal-sulfur cluster biosynthetic enzyme
MMTEPRPSDLVNDTFPDDETTARPSEEDVLEAMKDVVDPELMVNVVDLGLVYEATVRAADDGRRSVDVKMTLTAPGCGMGEILVDLPLPVDVPTP